MIPQRVQLKGFLCYACSRQAVFDHHLVKPADPEELQRLLASG